LTAKPGDVPKFTVRAHFSDGRITDVTRYVKWTAVNQSVINVDDKDQVKVLGHGESALSAWYLQRIAVATVTAPFPNDLRETTFANAPRRNWIDDRVQEKLQQLKLPPQPEIDRR
jgi:predicted RNA-binding protein with PIN domain